MTTKTESPAYKVRLRRPHEKQRLFIESVFKRIVIRAGRRGGKTIGIANRSVKRFLAGRRQLYAAPTAEQVETFWKEVCRALHEPIQAGVFYKNETEHIIELVGTDQRIKAKTAWNADSLRGDWADDLILDEWQLMDETAWSEVGAPMLLDRNGDAVFIYTPPSLRSKSITKARDPLHAPKMFKAALEDKTGRWQAIHFTSHDNPYISAEALHEITGDMTRLAYLQEIMAEDTDDVPGAIWKQELIDSGRVSQCPELSRIVVGVDPPGGATECGIVAAGIAKIGGVTHGYIIEDRSCQKTPDKWAGEILAVYTSRSADRVVYETNFGGDMVENTIKQAAKSRGITVAMKPVTASRGKQLRAEPVMVLYEQGLIHHVGSFDELEAEMVSWVPGNTKDSPNRLDALVWALTELMLKSEFKPFVGGV